MDFIIVKDGSGKILCEFELVRTQQDGQKMFFELGKCSIETKTKWRYILFDFVCPFEGAPFTNNLYRPLQAGQRGYELHATLHTHKTNCKSNKECKVLVNIELFRK